MMVIVGLGVSAAALMVGTQVVSNMHQSGVRAQVQQSLDTLQMLGLQYTQRGNALQDIRNFMAANPTNPNVVAMRDCLKGIGTNCAALAVDVPLPAAQPDMNAAFSVAGGVCVGAGPDCQIQRTLRYRLVCSSASSCESAVITVGTRYAGNAFKLAPRADELKLTADQIVDERPYDFSCIDANVGLGTGIDLAGRKGHCTPTPKKTCPDGSTPLMKNVSNAAGWSNVDGCSAPAASADCSAFGLSDASIWKSGCKPTAPAVSASPVFFWSGWADTATWKNHGCNKSCGDGLWWQRRQEARTCRKYDPVRDQTTDVAPNMCSGNDTQMGSDANDYQLSVASCNNGACGCQTMANEDFQAGNNASYFFTKAWLDDHEPWLITAAANGIYVAASGGSPEQKSPATATVGSLSYSWTPNANYDDSIIKVDSDGGCEKGTYYPKAYAKKQNCTPPTGGFMARIAGPAPGRITVNYCKTKKAPQTISYP
jgi:hypothetical protein